MESFAELYGVMWLHVCGPEGMALRPPALRDDAEGEACRVTSHWRKLKIRGNSFSLPLADKQAGLLRPHGVPPQHRASVRPQKVKERNVPLSGERDGEETQ
ncbi:hypothetical protein EYF80_035640 [Liparis tanakae]|uniref:Uncharacterized protein n=1 Tax=Liparis tanakae TaxID=230148 RepID=A0A4Z2GN93_9TELE|nr:hypothetical protein EYF80_035640 [Liparis tanakae]